MDCCLAIGIAGPGGLFCRVGGGLGGPLWPGGGGGDVFGLESAGGAGGVTGN